LNERIAGNESNVFNAVGINDDGLILAHAQKADESHAVLLATAQVAVDANRDESIAFDATDNTAPGKYYRFWLNNDRDRSSSNWKWSEKDPEIYESSLAPVDSDDKIINSPRDCEDLARLCLDTGNLLNFLKDGAGDLYVGLKWKNVGDSLPSIRLYRSADTNGGLGHIKDATVAARQADPASGFSSCLMDFGATGIDQVSPTARPADFIFNKHTFADLDGSQSKLHLLFEGVSEGKGQLCLVFLKKKNDGSDPKTLSSTAAN